MDDYIKREDAIKTLEGWNINGVMILGVVPTADVRENVKGHWVKDRYCSVCDFDKQEYDYYSDWRENFCPNCGADMRSKSC